MLTANQKVFIISRYYETNSIPMVIRDYAKEFKLKGRSKDVPKRHVIMKLVRTFENSLSLKDEPRSGVAYKTGKIQKTHVLKD